jgi:hypothetical protein
MSKRRPSDFGKRLNKVYRIGAAHALYSDDGEFYMQLERFPGALFDKGGFVLFKTEAEFAAAQRAGHLSVDGPAKADGKMRVNLHPNISSMPNYVLFVDHVASDLSADDAALVKLLLEKGFARHRIAALFDVDQQVINRIAAR